MMDTTLYGEWECMKVLSRFQSTDDNDHSFILEKRMIGRGISRGTILEKHGTRGELRCNTLACLPYTVAVGGSSKFLGHPP